MPTDEPPQSGPLDTPLLRRDLAAPARTLLDVFESVVEQYGDAAALDSGTEQLSYDDLADAVDAVADELNASGIGRGDRVGVRAKSGTTALYVAIIGILVAGAAYVPVDADDPDERARLVFGEADVAAVVGDDLAVVRRASARRGRPAPRTRPRRRRLGHLHLRLDRHAQGRRGHAPQRRGVRGRRGAAVPPGARRSGPATG